MAGRGNPEHVHPSVARTVRITWGMKKDGRLTDPMNHAFCQIMRFTRHELLNAPWSVVRPDIRPGHVSEASDLEARRQYVALREGESEIEHVSGWFQANELRGGPCIEVEDAVVIWNAAEKRWEGYADVSVDYLPLGPQFLTPLQRQPMDEYLAGRRLSREEVRELVQEELFERDAQTNNSHHSLPKARSDKGIPKLYPDKAIFEPKLKEALGGQWLPNEEEICEKLVIGTRVTLRSTLRAHGYLRPNEKLLACLRRLADEWFPRQ